MTSYTRQSTFIPGDVIKAEHGNDEFNQLVSFAAQATGHKHDGTAAEGAYVPVISDTTNTDKVEIVAGGAKTTGTHQVTGLLTADASAAITGNITVTGTVDTRDVATDGTKLDGIETAATADQTNAEIKTAYEANADTNEFSDAEQTKLAGIETAATADQTKADIDALNVDADTLDGSHATAFQPIDADLTAIAALANTDSNFIVGNGSAWVAETGATARTSLGLGTSATLDVGTSANEVVQLNGSAQLPAVDGSLLTGVTGVFTTAFTSSEQTITHAGALTLPHSLGSMPDLIQLRLICKTAEHEYSIGDEVMISMGVGNGSSGPDISGVSVFPDNTDVNIRFNGDGVNTISIIEKTSADQRSITETSWKLIVKAWV
jgi:hypothetical protein